MNEILIYSDIGEDYFGDGVSAKSIKSQLENMSGELSVRVNSPGGDVFDGFAIYNLLNQYEGEVTIHVDGLAASAASVIAMAGDNIVMAENALMMIHDPWTLSVGNAAEMRDTADLLDKIRDSIVTTYMSKTNLDAETVVDYMAKETWFNAAEAIEFGFASTTAESKKVVSNTVKPWIQNAPQPETIENQVAWRLASNKRKLALID